MSNLKWYEYTQNNSGGSFDSDDKVCHRVFIQAESDFESLVKAEDIGIYLDGCDDGLDCPCCGDRWYEATETIFPLEYGYGKTFHDIISYAKYLADEYGGWMPIDGRLYYHNGDVVDIKDHNYKDLW